MACSADPGLLVIGLGGPTPSKRDQRGVEGLAGRVAICAGDAPNPGATGEALDCSAGPPPGPPAALLGSACVPARINVSSANISPITRRLRPTSVDAVSQAPVCCGNEWRGRVVIPVTLSRAGGGFRNGRPEKCYANVKTCAVQPP